MSDYLSSDDIKKIEDSVSVIDYFLYLEKIGKVNFDRKSGHDYYFINDNSKFSVNKTGNIRHWTWSVQGIHGN